MKELAKAFEGDAAAAEVLRHLEAKKWRKARDAAKLLVKKDKARYQPLLVEANLGLFGEMLEKNLLSEAKTLLDYLQTIVQPEKVEELRGKLAGAQGAADSERERARGGGVVAAAVSREAGWEAVLRVAARGGADVTGEELRAIDAVVVSFDARSGPGGEADAKAAGELAAVQAACDAAADWEWDAMAEALRGLPSSSPFRHWKLFLRGVRHWFCGEKAEAEACFQRVPKGGACAVAVRVICGDATIPGQDLAEWNLALAGYPKKLGKAIDVASQAWDKGQYGRTMEEMCWAFREDLAADWSGLPACIRHELFRNHPQGGRIYDDRMFEATDRMPGKIHPLFLCELTGSFLTFFHIDSDDGFADEWEKYVFVFFRHHEKTPVLESVAWMMGAVFLMEIVKSEERVSFFGKREVCREERERAADFLRKSRDAWSDNYRCLRELVGVLKGLGEKGEVGRVLDDMAARFPKDKWTLVEAGMRARERKAFDKAIDFFARAREADPLDVSVAHELMVAYGVKLAKKKGADQAALWGEVAKLFEVEASRAALLREPWVLPLVEAMCFKRPLGAFDAMLKRLPNKWEFQAVRTYYGEVFDFSQPYFLWDGNKKKDFSYSWHEVRRIFEVILPLLLEGELLWGKESICRGFKDAASNFICKKKKLVADSREAFDFVCLLDRVVRENGGVATKWISDLLECYEKVFRGAKFGPDFQENPHFGYLAIRFALWQGAPMLRKKELDRVIAAAQLLKDRELLAKADEMCPGIRRAAEVAFERSQMDEGDEGDEDDEYDEAEEDDDDSGDPFDIDMPDIEEILKDFLNRKKQKAKPKPAKKPVKKTTQAPKKAVPKTDSKESENAKSGYVQGEIPF